MASAAVVAARTASAVTEGGADGHRKRQACENAREDLSAREFHLLPLPSASDLARRSGHVESKSRLDASSAAKSSLRTRADRRRPSTARMAARATCDFCGSTHARSDRQRLMWDLGSGRTLILADLCPRCASHADRLLELYGGTGAASLHVTRVAEASTRQLVSVRRGSAVIARSALYILIALATFFVVTLITARH
jgi:hypothetical protein